MQNFLLLSFEVSQLSQSLLQHSTLLHSKLSKVGHPDLVLHTYKTHVVCFQPRLSWHVMD